MYQSIYCANFELKPTEMCFIQYLPIKMAHNWITKTPANLSWIDDLVYKLVDSGDVDKQDYMYATIKHLYVIPGNVGNRPGWHIDGYLSDDINYIWSDRCPTEFILEDFNLSKDHEKSLIEMEEQAQGKKITIFPNNSLLRLDNTIVHRSPENFLPGMRTFVKISISKHKYNLEGNAHNYLFNYDWFMYKREESRNHPYVE